VRPHDIIVQLSDATVAQPADLLEALARDAIGKAHTLKVLRPEAGAYRELDIVIVPANPSKN
jgi:S1-C subfamily serine protease